MAVRTRPRAAASRRAAPKSRKWVYLFANGKAEGNAKMRDLLGGKGAGLAEMTNAKLPVPAGFTITTAACNAYFASGKKLPPGLWDQVQKALATVERSTKKKLVEEYKTIVRAETGKPFPTQPQDQLRLAIEAVFGSWFGQRAKDYRKQFKISDDLGTACSIVTMVYGNMGDDSGTGVAFTRDPNTGEKVLYGEYLTNAQGEDVVAGIRT